MICSEVAGNRMAVSFRERANGEKRAWRSCLTLPHPSKISSLPSPISSYLSFLPYRHLSPLSPSSASLSLFPTTPAKVPSPQARTRPPPPQSGARPKPHRARSMDDSYIDASVLTTGRYRRPKVPGFWETLWNKLTRRSGSSKSTRDTGRKPEGR